MTTFTVNDNATGTWSTRIGTVLELVRPGANPHHVIVRVPGQRRTFGFPSLWLDSEPDPEPAPARGLIVKRGML